MEIAYIATTILLVYGYVKAIKYISPTLQTQYRIREEDDWFYPESRKVYLFFIKDEWENINGKLFKTLKEADAYLTDYKNKLNNVPKIEIHER